MTVKGDALVASELRQIRQQLEVVLATQRFLLAIRLIEDGQAKNLREAGKITRDPARLASLYPVPE